LDVKIGRLTRITKLVTGRKATRLQHANSKERSVNVVWDIMKETSAGSHSHKSTGAVTSLRPCLTAGEELDSHRNAEHGSSSLTGKGRATLAKIARMNLDNGCDPNTRVWCDESLGCTKKGHFTFDPSVLMLTGHPVHDSMRSSI